MRIEPVGNVERKEWIDYLRGVGVILILLGHSLVPQKINAWIYGFHMPLFYIISGYLHDRDKWAEKGFQKFVRTRFKNYVIPYIIWCTICFAASIPVLLYTFRERNQLGTAVLQNIGWIMTSLQTGDTNLPQLCMPLWFLLSIFISSLVLYGMLCLDWKKQILTCFAFIVFNYILNKMNYPVFPWHIDVSLIGAIFMLIGYYFRKLDLLSKKIHPLIMLAMFILAQILIVCNERKSNVDLYNRIYHNYFLLIIGASMMSFCLFWICKNSEVLLFRKILVEIGGGGRSILIMGLNFPIILCLNIFHMIFSSINSKIPVKPVWPETAFVSIAVSYALCRLFSYYSAKYRKLNILIGK